MSSKTLQAFRASLTNDVARPNRFEVIIPVPTKLLRYTDMVKRLTLRCESSEIPSVSIATNPREIYGTGEKLAYMKNYSDLNLSFICSGDMKERKFFDAWTNLIVPNSSKNPEYQDNYTTTITVNHYRVDGKLEYSFDITKAFPTYVGQQQLNWGTQNQYMILPVTFSYYEVEPSSLKGYITDLKDSLASNVVDIGETLLASIATGLTGKNSDTADNWRMTDIAKTFNH